LTAHPDESKFSRVVLFSSLSRWHGRPGHEITVPCNICIITYRSQQHIRFQIARYHWSRTSDAFRVTIEDREYTATPHRVFCKAVGACANRIYAIMIHAKTKSNQILLLAYTMLSISSLNIDKSSCHDGRTSRPITLLVRTKAHCSMLIGQQS
jgi:hypothetical protein